MQRGKFRRTERRFGRHEIFSEKIWMLDHRPFERLKNHATLFQVFGNDIALDQLIAGENHARGELIEAARILLNIRAIIVRELRAEFERREIKKIDIGKPPGMIFSRWPRDRFKFFPRGMLLIAKPVRQIARLYRTRKDSFRAYGFIMSD